MKNLATGDLDLSQRRGYCQVGESRPNIVGLEGAPSTISWGRIGLEALNLTIPSWEMK
jgi:hypothetical protein